jgi:hypothetical protein
MQRSRLLEVIVLCPHFRENIVAQRNLLTDRLVACNRQEECVQEVPADDGTVRRERPAACPVFPRSPGT